MPQFRLAWPVIGGLAVVSLGLVLFAGRLALSTRRSRVVSGREEMIGSIAVVQDWSDGQGHVFVHGERWNAVSATPLDTGERVQIIAIDGMTLREIGRASCWERVCTSVSS